MLRTDSFCESLTIYLLTLCISSYPVPRPEVLHCEVVLSVSTSVIDIVFCLSYVILESTPSLIKVDTLIPSEGPPPL